MNTPEVFWSRVRRRGVDECWPWLGGTQYGYGIFTWKNKPHKAHRMAAFFVGMVKTPAAPVRKARRGFVLHRCDNRSCCNPRHFFVGNSLDNRVDCVRKGRHRGHGGGGKYRRKLGLPVISDARVRKIRRLCKDGCGHREVAARCGVSRGYVWKLANQWARK